MQVPLARWKDDFDGDVADAYTNLRRSMTRPQIREVLRMDDAEGYVKVINEGQPCIAGIVDERGGSAILRPPEWAEDVWFDKMSNGGSTILWSNSARLSLDKPTQCYALSWETSFIEAREEDMGADAVLAPDHDLSLSPRIHADG